MNIFKMLLLTPKQRLINKVLNDARAIDDNNMVTYDSLLILCKRRSRDYGNSLESDRCRSEKEKQKAFEELEAVKECLLVVKDRMRSK